MLVCFTFQTADLQKDKESQTVANTEHRRPSSSFVDCVMVALTTETEGDVNSETFPGPAGTVVGPTCSDVVLAIRLERPAQLLGDKDSFVYP